MRKYSIRFLLIIAVVFTFAAGYRSQTAATSADDRFDESRQKAFELVWRTINEKHYDPIFNGVDWAAMKVKYLPLARTAKTDEDFHNVLRRMLSELKLSHFNIFPPSPPIASNDTGDGVGTVGLEIAFLDDAAVISRVEKNSTAEAGGLKPGFVITAVDGKPVGELLRPLREALATRPTTDMMKRVYLERSLQALINGKPESSVKLSVSDAADRPMQVELERTRWSGIMSEPLGNFPRQRVIFESSLIEGKIGYIRFNMWVIPQAAKIRAAIREFASADGIIFDLRGNPGGVGGIAGGTAGLLTDTQFSLGTMTSRSGSLKMLAYPQTDPFKGKVVILTDHGSASTSEMFAAGMQEAGRGTVVGGVTAGAILLSVFDPLPTGYMFQYVISDYRSPNNILIEGRGVQPDVKVELTRKSLLEGRDIQLEAAIAEIKKGTSPK